MKKIIMMLAILIISTAAIAQKSERTNAFMYNKNGQYDKAKESIDKAVEHEKTREDAKTWMYRGIIYLNIVYSDQFKGTDPQALDKSLESFQKAMELDKEDDLKQEIEIYPRVEAIGQQYFSHGVDDFNNQDYPQAALDFRKAYEVGQMVNKVDTLALLNAALSSIRGENYPQALDYYQQLLDIQFSEPDVYKNMALAYRNMEDLDNMMAILKVGREKYPEDSGLLLEEINSYLAQGQGARVVDDLKSLVEKDPTNYSIFFVLGTIYGDEINEAMYDKDKAEMYYEKAIELNPDYYDAIYNLGALYINESNKLQVTANDLPLSETEKYNQITEEANAIIKKALPYLEKANVLQPNNEETIAVLKSIYSRFNMADKLKSLSE